MAVSAGYKQTEVGVIPEDWQLRPLLTTVRIANGQVDPRIDPYKSMVLVAPDHIESRTGRLLAQISAEDQNAISGKYLFKPGDIVYSKIRPYLRKVMLADFHGLCSADMYPLTPAPNVSPGFIFAILLGHPFSSFAEAISARSGIPKINRDELAEYVVALPPTLAEQQAIAEALRDVDGLISGVDGLIAKKRLIKQGAMQELLTGQRRLPGFAGDWEVKTLDSLGRRGRPAIKAGPFGSSLTKDKYVAEGYKVYGQEQVIRGDYLYGDYFIPKALFEELKSCAVEAGDILLSLVGTAGRVLVIPAGAPEGVINPRLIRFSFDQNLISSQFFQYLFETETYQTLLERSAQGGTMGVLNATLLRPIAIPVPSLPEQTAIAQILADMDAEIAALGQKRAKTVALKQGMMQSLLTGAVRLG